MIGKKINQLATELAPVSTDLTIIGDPTTGVSKKITLAQLGAIFSGAVSFYTNLAAFPNPGTIDVIYCAKDTKKLYLWSGSAYVEVFPSQALLDTYQLRSEKGNANGYASLDSGGKVPISQLPSSIMEYKGTWNASTNTPTLANGTGDTGDVYICNVAGTVDFGAGGITFAVGDYVIYSGTIWQRSSGAVGTVTSVALTVGGDAISVSGSPLTTSGTLGLTFNGTTAQYIRGNGTLETFPSLTGFVPYTGATANVNLGTNNITAQNNILNGNGTDTGSYLAFKQYSGSNSGADGYTSLYALAQNSLYIRYSQTDLSQKNVDLSSALLGTTTRQYLFPDKNGTFAMVSDLTGGTVTSVAALTIGTTGTDLSSTVANGTTTPVITLNVPTASATNRGALSSEDWASFNSKQNAITLTTTGTSGAATLVGATLNIPNYTSGLTGYVPYTGATANLDLGTFTLLAAKGTFSSSGSGDTVGITHSSGSGIALNITKGGNGEGLYINKTSGSGNAATIIGTLNATTLVKSGGTSSQYLMADGSVSTLTNPVTGTGTTNYLPKFTGASTIGNSLVFDNGTNVGINNAFPSEILEITKNQNATTRLLVSNSNSVNTTSRASIRTNSNAVIGEMVSINGLGVYLGTASNHELSLMTNGSQRAVIDTSGNLGLGVSPSAWASGFTALQVKNASFWSTGNDASIIANAYYDGSNYRYIGTAGASRTYHNTDGSIAWSQAPSGTAGNAITFTQAMTLDASGNLGLGTTSPSGYGSGYPTMDLRGSVGSGIKIGNTTDVALLYANSTATYLRTSSAKDLILGTFDTPRLTIASTGAATFSSDVTIGASSQLYLTSGDLRYSSNAGFGIVSQNGNRLVSIQNGAFGVTGSVTASGIASLGTAQTTVLAYIGDTNTVNTRYIKFARASALTDIVNIQGVNGGVGAANISLQSEGGLVGIGCTPNFGKLEIQGATTDKRLYINTNSSYSNSIDIFGINSIGSLIPLGIGGSTIQFYTSATESMRITSGGNVGIGGTSAPEKLNVVGAIMSTGAITGHGANRTTLSQEGANGAFWQSYGANTTTVGTFTLRQASSDFSVVRSPLIIGTTGAATFSDSIKTGEPDTGYGRAAIKIGARNTGQAFNSGGHLPVNIDGTIYFINVYSSLP